MPSHPSECSITSHLDLVKPRIFIWKAFSSSLQNAEPEERYTIDQAFRLLVVDFYIFSTEFNVLCSV